MDAFEQIVGQLLTEEGYWTLIGYKADIKQVDAKELDKGSMPRPEIDIVAYKPRENILYLIEVKSFIDSSGVRIKAFEDLENNFTGRYKLLTSEKYRKIVSRIVQTDLYNKGLTPSENVQVEFGLVAGNIHKATERTLKEFFHQKGKQSWLIWGPETIIDLVKKLAKKGYENNSIVMIAKLMNPAIKMVGAKERKKVRNSL